MTVYFAILLVVTLDGAPFACIGDRFILCPLLNEILDSVRRIERRLVGQYK